jgi:hypothetical protein
MACGAQGPQSPETLELDLVRFAVPEGADAADAAATLGSSQYGHLQELVTKLQLALDSQVRQEDGWCGKYLAWDPPPGVQTAQCK